MKIGINFCMPHRLHETWWRKTKYVELFELLRPSWVRLESHLAPPIDRLPTNFEYLAEMIMFLKERKIEYLFMFPLFRRFPQLPRKEKIYELVAPFLELFTNYRPFAVGWGNELHWHIHTKELACRYIDSLYLAKEEFEKVDITKVAPCGSMRRELVDLLNLNGFDFYSYHHYGGGENTRLTSIFKRAQHLTNEWIVPSWFWRWRRLVIFDEVSPVYGGRELDEQLKVIWLKRALKFAQRFGVDYWAYFSFYDDRFGLIYKDTIKPIYYTLLGGGMCNAKGRPL